MRSVFKASCQHFDEDCRRRLPLKKQAAFMMLGVTTVSALFILSGCQFFPGAVDNRIAEPPDIPDVPLSLDDSVNSLKDDALVGPVTFFLDLETLDDSTPQNRQFRDIVFEAVDKKVINPKTDGPHFHPEQPVTRGEFFQWLAKYLALKQANPEYPSFDDVPEGSPYYPYIEAVVQAGIIEGHGRNFGPGEPLSREGLCILYNRILGKRPLKNQAPSGKDPKRKDSKTKDTLLPEAVEKSLKAFKDTGEITEEARPYVALALKNGIPQTVFGLDEKALSDVGFQPHKSVSRKEALLMIYQLAPPPEAQEETEAMDSAPDALPQKASGH